MIARPEDEELLLLLVPVAAQAREASGAVVQGVRQDAQAHVSVRNDSAAEVGVLGEFHDLHLESKVD